MRRLSVVAMLLLYAGLSSGQASTNPVDLKAEEAAIHVLMDKFDKAVVSADVPALASLITEDALVCGTDPSEFWNKQEFTEFWTKNPDFSYPEITPMSERVVKVSSPGNSAMVVTQFFISFSPKIPWRQTYHCVKMNDNWMIHFMNVAFIPKNKDIRTINEAVE